MNYLNSNTDLDEFEFLTFIPNNENVYGFRSREVPGEGDGEGSGFENGFGNGYGDGEGIISGDASLYPFLDPNGRGYGDGWGSGSGYGYLEDPNELLEFLY
jgi:hypothetical protein